MPRGPATVRYQWVRSDGAGAPVQSVRFTGYGAQRQTVRTSWTLGADYSGWQAVRILSPASATSERARFSVDCRTTAAVSGISVAPREYIGNCDPGVTFTANATIRVSGGPTTVRYRWLRSDGAASAVESVSFGPGTSERNVSRA